MSLKRDYILTMVEQLAQFIARLVFLKETARGEQALSEINEFYKHFVELDAADIRALSHEKVIELCTDEGGLDVQRSTALASILKEEGDIMKLQGRDEDATASHTRALALLLATYGEGDRALPLGVVEKLDLVIDRAIDLPMPGPYRMMLLRYLEQSGLYADAENVLFDLIESGEPGAVQEGLGFYDRLAALSDEDLENGNLPREELEEGRAALGSRS
jgi:hypothetical protein